MVLRVFIIVLGMTMGLIKWLLAVKKGFQSLMTADNDVIEVS